MDAFQRHRSPPSDRFLRFFSPGNLTAVAGAGVELHEDEVLWTGSEFSAPSPHPPPAGAGGSPKAANATLSPSASSFRQLSEKNFGILAALPEEENKLAGRNPSFLHRNASSPVSSFSSASTSPNSSSSSARMIPLVPKPKQMDYSLQLPAGRIHHQSAPVNVPVVPRRQQTGLVEEADEDDADDDEMLPPHEMVARKDSPMTTFSMLEGVGRTLKGRDLRRVRNAVWRRTGYVD